jgi:ribosome-associated heat shock protein Hsp15
LPKGPDRPASAATPAAGQRIDKWLWCARFMKSRALAAEFAERGLIRLLRQGARMRIEKASAAVRPGDEISFPLGDRARVILVRALATRRGPASEARRLYDDLSPAAAPQAPRPAARAGRPSKRDRRALAKLKHGA